MWNIFSMPYDLIMVITYLRGSFVVINIAVQIEASLLLSFNLGVSSCSSFEHLFLELY